MCVPKDIAVVPSVSPVGRYEFVVDVDPLVIHPPLFVSRAQRYVLGDEVDCEFAASVV